MSDVTNTIARMVERLDEQSDTIFRLRKEMAQAEKKRRKRVWLSRQKKAERFLTQENTIVKDGYVYVRVNEIPFDELK